MAHPAFAGKRLVTVNLHPTASASNCAPTTCPENVAPPLSNLAAFANLGGSAFHVGSDCEAVKARCEYAHNSRTKILSSDVAGADPLDAQGWISSIEGSEHPVGRIHFEHFDKCLSNWAVDGNPMLTGFSSFPEAEDCEDDYGILIGPRAMLEWIRDGSGASTGATRLLQNGTIWTDPESPRRLQWDVQDGTGFTTAPKRLIGLGFMGALAAGDARLAIDPYLRDLRAYNVHFTRIWAVEAWTGQAPSATEGPTPFTGTFAGDYDLGSDSALFYDRLRRFAQEAADRGIVVQLSLFDKHGLICPGIDGRYKHSPYKNSNNAPQNFMDNTWDNCSCNNLVAEAPGSFVAQNCWPLPLFIGRSGGQYDDDMEAIHARFLRRVGEETGAVGNMLYEVINEALAPHGSNPGDWPDSAPGTGTTMNQAWQKEMVDEMRLSLPIDSPNGVHIARDAFNGEASWPEDLDGKLADVRDLEWESVTNARVALEDTESGGLNPARTMGYVTGNGDSEVNYSAGELDFDSGNPAVAWTKLQIRADVTCNQGHVKVGFKAADGTMTYMIADCGQGGEWTSTTLRVAQELPPNLPQTLAAGAIWVPGNEHNIRLLITKSPTGVLTGSVYRDGNHFLKNFAIPSTGFERAFFWASDYGEAPYPPNIFKIDNFEAARFCDDVGQDCIP